MWVVGLAFTKAASSLDLRGRGGTDPSRMAGHAIGSPPRPQQP